MTSDNLRQSGNFCPPEINEMHRDKAHFAVDIFAGILMGSVLVKNNLSNPNTIRVSCQCVSSKQIAHRIVYRVAIRHRQNYQRTADNDTRA